MGIRSYLLFAATVLISLVTEIFQNNINNRIGKCCMKDFMIYYNYKIAPYMLLTVLAFMVTMYLYKMYDAQKIIRYTDIRRFYIKVLLGICAQLLIYLAVVFVIVVPGGALGSGFVIDNWKQSDSYASIVFGIRLLDTPLFTIIAAEFAGYFAIGIIDGMIGMIAHRFTGNLFIGYFMAVVINYIFTAEPNISMGRINEFYINESVYQRGFCSMSFIFPAAAAFALLLIIMNMGKFDLIKKR